MATDSSWSMRGIDPRVRERARSGAREDGVTVGEWINRKILHGGDGDVAHSAEGLAAAVDRLSRRIEAAEHRSTLAITGIDQSVLGLVSRLQAAEGGQAELEEQIGQAVTDLHAARLALLDRIERLESEEHGGRSSEALKSLESSLARLEDQVASSIAELRDKLEATAEHTAAVEQQLSTTGETLESRFTALDQTTADTADAVARMSQDVQAAGATADETRRGLTDFLDTTETRLAQAEIGLEREAEAREAAEQQLAAYAERLAAAEANTNAALKALESSLGVLEDRVAEGGGSGDGVGADALRQEFGGQLETLGRELSELVEDTRSAVAERLKSVASEQQIDAISARLDSVLADIGLSEKRRSEALERIVGEVARLSSAVDERLAHTEERTEQLARNTADAVARTEAAAERSAVAAERAEAAVALGVDSVNKAAAAHEERLAKIAAAAGEGSTMAAELEARLANMQSRQDAAVGEVTAKLETVVRTQEQTVRAVSAVDQRVERLSGDLTDHVARTNPENLEGRIRDSEERTRRMVEDAMARLEARKSGAPTPPEEHAPEPAPADAAPSADPVDEPLDFVGSETTAVIASLNARMTLNAEDVDDAGFADADGKTIDPSDPDAAYLKAMDEQGGAPSSPTAKPFGERAFGDRIGYQPPLGPGVAGSADPEDPFGDDAGEDADDRLSGFTDEPARGRSPEDDDMLSRLPSDVVAAMRERDAGLPSPSDVPPERLLARPQRHKGRGMLIAAGGMAFAAVGAAAYTAYENWASGNDDDTPDPNAAGDPRLLAGAPTAEPNPLPVVSEADVRADLAEAGADPVSQYRLGLARLEAGLPERGAQLLLEAANAGLAAAQHRLSQLYDSGVGIAANPGESRRWAERAANAGHRQAMHQLGVKYANGRGAPQSFEQAARWFEEAAILGSTDSQFNLGVLYEQGLGVRVDLAQAHAWFSLAGAAGDADALDRASTLARTMTQTELDEAAALIEQFALQPLDPIANGLFDQVDGDVSVTPSADVIREAQALLNAMGYEAGDSNGELGPATRRATIEFQRDAGLPETGRIDLALVDVLKTRAQER